MQVGAVWVQATATGAPYLSFALHGPLMLDPRAWHLVAFAAAKTSPQAPDYLLFVAEHRPREAPLPPFDDAEPGR